MWKEKNQKFMRVLMPIAMLCLSSCAKENYDYCPVYPSAGENVAEELEKLSFEQAPHFWEWLSRIDKLRRELALCQ